MLYIDTQNLSKIECSELLYYACETYDELFITHKAFLQSKISASFCHYGPMYDETKSISSLLLKMLDHGFITTDSQNGHNNDNSHTKPFGFGYVEGLLRKDVLNNMNLTGSSVGLFINGCKIMSCDGNSNFINLMDGPLCIRVDVFSDKLSNLLDEIAVGYFEPMPCIMDMMDDFDQQLLAFIRENYETVLFVDLKTGNNHIMNEVVRLLENADGQMVTHYGDVREEFEVMLGNVVNMDDDE